MSKETLDILSNYLRMKTCNILIPEIAKLWSYTAVVIHLVLPPH